MTAIIPSIRTMTFDEAHQAGLYSRGLILEHQGKSYILSAGMRTKYMSSPGAYVSTF